MSFTVANREILHEDESDEECITIPLTGKEGIDLLLALRTLRSDMKDGQFNTTLPVEDVLNIARGGQNFPDSVNILIPSDDHARVLIHALLRYETTDGYDTTGDTISLIITALDSSPLNSDTNSLRNLLTTPYGRKN